MSQLIGREAELRAGDELFAALRRGSREFLVIAGEPGIGKTSLVSALLQSAEGRAYLALAGAGAELEKDLPFGVVADALDPYVSTLDGAVLGGLDHDSVENLGAVLPSFRSGRALPILQAERYRAYQAVKALLERLTWRNPLVLALDDMHWADPATVELISYLLRHPPDAPVLVLLTLRPHQTPPRLKAVLEAARHDAKVRWLELQPLSREQSETLLGEDVDPPVRERLYRESGGNPFYLLALRRVAAHGAGSTGASVGPDRPTPERVLLSIAEELSLVSPPARSFLEAGAVVGDPFDIDLAAATAGMAEQEIFGSLDELLEAGLLHATDSPRRFRFRHPIVRQAVYDSTGRGWRLAAHRRAADALAARGAPPSARVHHVERYAGTGDKEAITFLVEAATSVAAHAPTTAATWYASALRLVPETPEHAPQRLELSAARAVALGSSGLFKECWETLRGILDVLPPEATETRVTFEVFCAAVGQQLGRQVEGHERLTRLLEELPDPNSSDAVRLQLALSEDAILGWDYPQTAKWGEAALLGANRLGDRSLMATGAGMLAIGQCFNGMAGDARANLTRAGDLLDRLRDDELGTMLCCASVGWAEHCAERYESARRHLQRGIDVSRASGHGYYIVALLSAQSLVLTAMGLLAEAQQAAEPAVESARLSGSPLAMAWALASQSLVATFRGDLTTARASGEESLAVGKAVDASVPIALGGWALATALLEAGESARVVSVLVDAAGGEDLPMTWSATRSPCYEILTRAELARGRVGQAERWCERAEAAAAGLGLAVPDAAAKRARAAVLLARERPHEAAELALAGADGADAVGARLEGARSRLLAGCCLARAGERERAVAELTHTADVLSQCGAMRLLSEASAELRRLGRRLPSRRRSGDGDGRIPGLSRRESEVAVLVSRGKSNREIAAELFLSERTVENHLSHIFTKLGVSSRTALVSALGSKVPLPR